MDESVLIETSDDRGALRKWIHGLPKAELHVHLEGAIKLETLVALAEKNGSPLPPQVAKKLQKDYAFSGFCEFGDLYLDIVNLIRSPYDLETIVSELGKQMRDENIFYAEVTWTPQLHVNNMYGFEAWLNAANSGREYAEKAFGVTIRWILDICRDRYQGAADVVRWATSTAAREGHVVALGLGGTECDFPARLFKDAFAQARAAGLKVVPHAGEHNGKLAGPLSVWGALKKLKANRIGHGNRAAEDKKLLRYLARYQVPLELCPMSNVHLRTYETLDRHPLRKFLDAGCLVTINTDDPGIFGMSLTEVLLQCAITFKLSRQNVKQITLNAFEVAFDRQAAMTASRINDFEQALAA